MISLQEQRTLPLLRQLLSHGVPEEEMDREEEMDLEEVMDPAMELEATTGDVNSLYPFQPELFLHYSFT